MNISTSSAADELPALLCPEIPKFTVTITPDAIEQRKFAIECAQEIVSVASLKEREDALAAASMIKSVLKRMEDTRTTVKAPVLAATKEIDGKAKAFSDGLKVEQARVERLLNDYQLKCNLAAEELRAAEMKEMAEQAKAAVKQDDFEKLRELATREAEINQPTRVEGARMRQFLDYDVIDILALANAHPEFVKIEPRRSILLAFINTPGFVSLDGVSTRMVAKLDAKADL